MSNRNDISDAASKGDAAQIRRLIEADPQCVHVTDDRGQTPLHEAAYKGHLDAFEVLVTNGADFLAKDSDGFTPLDWIAKRGHNHIQRWLVAWCEQNCSPEVRSRVSERISSVESEPPSFAPLNSDFGYRKHKAAQFQKDFRNLKGWLTAYIVATALLWIAVFAGIASNPKSAGSGSDPFSEAIGLFALAWLVPHFVTFFYAYRVNVTLNDEGLYKPGAWQMIVAPFIGCFVGLVLILGWLLVLSFVRVVIRLQKTNPNDPLFTGS